MEKFIHDLPKIELHAHLNGSLNIDAIRELGEAVHGTNSSEFLKLCEKFIEFDKSPVLSQCFEKFKFIHELTATQHGLQLATDLVIRDFAKDNVIYLELRTTPKENVYMTRRAYIEHVLAAIKKAQHDYPTICVKLLLSIDRSQPLTVAAQTIDLAIEYNEKEPATVAGIDLSGNPALGKFKDFEAVLLKVRKAGLPLMLHCAEIENPEEITQMIEFGMQRCGHGTFLTAKQIEELKKQQTAIECCLTSNVKCGTVSSFEDHHIKRLMAAKCDTVLCTDDSGVFDTTLSQEFIIAVETFGLTREKCIELTLTAVKHAVATTDEKRLLIEKIMDYHESVTE